MNDDRVHALLEAHDGTLWIGTMTGLARYSGASSCRLSRGRSPRH